MKKQFHLFIGILVVVAFSVTQKATAQAPQKMSYQSVIRNSSNALLANTPVGIKISVLQGNESGIAVYEETQSATTNTNGLISLQIGTGNATFGSFSEIDWATGPYFIRTEIDPTGGSNYSIIGTQQMASVPYALYAANANVPGVPGPQGATGAEGPQGPAGATGSVGSVTAISGTSNTNGATISGGNLTLTPADGTHGGVVTTGTQTFAGNKTFSGTTTASSFVKTGGTSSQYLMADGSVTAAPAPAPINGYPFMPIQNATSTITAGTKSYWYIVRLTRDTTISGIQLYVALGSDSFRCGIYRGYVKTGVSGSIALVGQTTDTAIITGLPDMRKSITAISGQSLTFAAGDYMTIAFHSAGSTAVYYQSSPLASGNTHLAYSSTANYVAAGFPATLTQTSISAAIVNKVCFELY